MIPYDPQKDAYAILGVHPEASRDEIEAAYRQAALTWHPDKSPAPDAGERFQEVLQAAKTLRNARQRKIYDLARGDWRARQGFNRKPPRPKPASRSRKPTYEAPKDGHPLPPPPEWLAPAPKKNYHKINKKIQKPPTGRHG